MNYYNARTPNGKKVVGTPARGSAPSSFELMAANGKTYEVDPSTIAPWSGLKDKKGKPLFAGALISFEDNLGAVITAVVKHGDFTHLIQNEERERRAFGFYYEVLDCTSEQEPRRLTAPVWELDGFEVIEGHYIESSPSGAA